MQSQSPRYRPSFLALSAAALLMLFSACDVQAAQPAGATPAEQTVKSENTQPEPQAPAKKQPAKEKPKKHANKDEVFIECGMEPIQS